MSTLFLKRYVSNLFFEMSKNIVNILENDNFYCHSQSDVNLSAKGLTEVIRLLTYVLTKIEDIYYKYFLYPNLQKLASKT